jgi:hypothetical protein
MKIQEKVIIYLNFTMTRRDTIRMGQHIMIVVGSTTPTATGTTKQKTNQNKKNENKMMNQQQLMTTTNHSCWLGRVWVFTGYRKIKKARVF